MFLFQLLTFLSSLCILLDGRVFGKSVTSFCYLAIAKILSRTMSVTSIQLSTTQFRLTNKILQGKSIVILGCVDDKLRSFTAYKTPSKRKCFCCSDEQRANLNQST